VNTRRYLLRGD